MANKSCGTCRDRRILCDRVLPTCSNCSRSDRKCQGYGLRLSWPKANDRKRSLVGKVHFQLASIQNTDLSDSRLINLTYFDMDLHRHLSIAKPNKLVRQISIPVSMGWNPLDLNNGRKSLIHYFHTTVSHSLRTWHHDSVHVGNILLRMALSDGSPSSSALLNSLLAISSLHRYGSHPQAAKYKISALQALRTASRGHLNLNEVKLHAAAGMLLYSIEILDVTCTSSQWMCHIAGVKEILKASSIHSSEYDTEFTTLLDWVYYHDLLARFSIWHYRIDDNVSKRLAGPNANREYCFREPLKLSHMRPPSFAILEQLIEVCETVSTQSIKTKSGQSLEDYHDFLKQLQWRIKRTPLHVSTTKTSSNPDDDRLIMELYHLSALLYLTRASGNTLTPSQAPQWIDRAFAIFAQLAACSRQLPLFILGIEARSDEERITVLDLFKRSEGTVLSKCALFMMQCVWKQDDLAGAGGGGRELDYVEKVGAIISSCNVMMTFV